MRLNLKTNSIFLGIFSTLTIVSAITYFLGYARLELVMLFLGFMQIFSGLNVIIKSSNYEKSKNMNMSSTTAGKIAIVLGSVIVGMAIIQLF